MLTLNEYINSYGTYTNSAGNGFDEFNQPVADPDNVDNDGSVLDPEVGDPDADEEISDKIVDAVLRKIAAKFAQVMDALSPNELSDDDIEDFDSDNDPTDATLTDDQEQSDVGTESDFDDLDDSTDPAGFTSPDDQEKQENFQGEIREVPGARLVYKRKSEGGDFEELWVYTMSRALRDETAIRQSILAGTDIPVNAIQSPDGKQECSVWTIGSRQMLKITGLPS